MTIGDAFDKQAVHAQKRLTLLNAAAEMFNERGYANASLEAVALRLKISKAAVYYYFKNKQEILSECYEISFDIWADALRTAHREGKTGRTKLESFMRRYLELGFESQNLIIIREWSALEDPVRQKVETRRRKLRNQTREIIKEGIADGTLADCNPKVAVTIIGSSISWLLRMYRAGGGVERDAFIAQVVNILLYGLVGQRDGSRGHQTEK